MIRSVLCYGSCAVCLILLAACDDSHDHDGDDVSHDAGNSAGREVDAGSSDDAGASGRSKPRYAVSTSVLTNDTATSYIAVVDSLDEGPRVDLDDALELGGGARAYGPENGNVVYATSSENGTLTEVTFDAAGKPSAGRTVSFVNLGITSTTGGNVHYFVSPTKAYFVSQDALEIVVWNPRKMEITKTVPLELESHLISKDGYFYFYPRPIVIGDRLVLISNQSDANDIDGPTVVSVIDPAEDRVLSTTSEPRCHALLQSAVDADGDRYFASSDYAASVHFLAPDGEPAPCMLRMRKDQTAFDPSWSRALDDQLHTGLWTGVTPGAAGAMFVQSIDERAASVKAAAEPFDITVATPWRWHTVRDGAVQGEAIAPDDLISPPLFPAIEVDGSAYVSLWDEKDTTLVNLSAGDVPQKARVVPGFVFNLVRIH